MLPFNRAVLLDMLTYCRPSGSATERLFITRYIACLPGATVDPYGNWHVTIGDAPVVWSCHTDTVHRSPGRQTTHYDAITGMVSLSRKSRRMSSCLGADDTAGVYVCYQMILSGIPGHYIFHTAEEIGGHGSSDIAAHAPELLDGATCAIALDRKGRGDIITHQFSECCSDAFALSLGAQLDTLSGGALTYTPSNRGIFTDTANYTAIVPECTNLSVGYFDGHTTYESLDTVHLELLYEALCEVDISALVIERSPVDELSRWTYIDDSAILAHDRNPFECWCAFCGIAYDPMRSDAMDDWRYCGYECERANTKFTPQSSMYLDPAFDNIQFALRKCDVCGRPNSEHRTLCFPRKTV